MYVTEPVFRVLLENGKGADRSAGKVLKEVDSAMQIQRVKESMRFAKGLNFSPCFGVPFWVHF